MSRQQPPRSGQTDHSGYLSELTIAALASAVGGAIAVIRISGPRAFWAVEQLAKKPLPAEQFKVRTLYRLVLNNPDQEELLDDSLFVRFEAPASFTGEDVVELHVHGGSFTATRILEALARIGVRQALPGEFSFRAVRNGKMSISQAQGVSDLIQSSNDDAATLALEKLSGTQNLLLSGLAEALRKLAVLGEVGIDFSDQDVEELSLPNLKKKLVPLLDTLQKLRASFDRGVRLQDGIGVVFVGLPNAGKSSFFNALLGEDRSIVSDVAGTTRDVVRERITLRGKHGSVTLKLEDTAGLRPSEDVVENKGIERTKDATRRADLILFLVDSSDSKQNEQIALQWGEIQATIGSSVAQRALGILTKTDLSSAGKSLDDHLKTLEIKNWVKTSAQTGDGIQEAIEKIVDHCEKLVHRKKGEVLLTRLDQLDAVSKAIEHLERAQETPETDLFASDIKQALYALGSLIGETLPDDILGRIFSSFCIGK
jgi:tRNA modification GTPase